MAFEQRQGNDVTTPNDTIGLLRSVSALAELEESLLRRMAAQIELVSLPAGEWLFRAGEEATAAYVVASGRLEVVAEGREETTVRVLRRGSAVGELALLRGGLRSASVRARRDSTVISLERRAFEALLHDSPAFALALTRAMGQQLASTLAPAMTTPEPRTIAIVALDPGVKAGVAFDALANELDRYGTTATFRAAPGDQPHNWAGQLGRAEAQQDRVALLADAGDPGDQWTAFCIGEADLILALTTGRPDPAWSGHAASLLDCELVVIDAPARDELIDRLHPRLVRAVRGREGLATAARELGRRAAGRAVGVVLSGGGARAFSHIGVIEELRRAGVAIDRIAGVSLGSLVAASVARGDTADETYTYFRRYFVERNPSGDYTLPLVAMFRGRKTARLMDEVFGDTRIEELQIPFFCTSVDLMRSEPVVHRTGLLAQAILASLSIPGVFPPVLDRHRRVLVDGGVIDNLPVLAMAEDSGGPVIAIDVSNVAGSSRTATRDGPLASAGVVLRRWITGSSEVLPRLPETIVRCMMLGSAGAVAVARQHADLVITADVSRVGLLEWQRLPDARRAGIAAAREAIQQHPEFFAQIRAS